MVVVVVLGRIRFFLEFVLNGYKLGFLLKVGGFGRGRSSDKAAEERRRGRGKGRSSGWNGVVSGGGREAKALFESGGAFAFASELVVVRCCLLFFHG